MKQIKHIFFLMIPLGLLFITSITLYAEESNTENNSNILMSATEYDYPPFSVTDSGEADGFSVELLKAVVHEIGMEIEFKVDAWNIIKEELRNNQLDVLPLVGYNQERDQYFDFTIPYIVMNGNIFIRKDDEGLIRSEDDLHGKQLIVMRGDNAQEYAVENGWSDNLILTDTYVDAFKLLNEGKYDAVIAQSLVGEKLINDLNLSKIVPVYTYENDVKTKIKVRLTGFEQKFCFAVPEGHSELLAILNEGLSIVSENGTYDRLYTKWFPFLIENQPSMMDLLRSLLIILIPILFLLLLASFIIIRKLVKEKTKYLEQENETITYMSIHDSLTGLYNRRFFDEELRRLDHPKYLPLTLLVADLNGLKLINDTLGHQAGDESIKNAANLLKEASRDSDIVARWGGDEFVIIFPNTNEKAIDEIIKRIKELSKKHVNTYGELSLSFGYETKYIPEQSIYQLFKTAEDYMYKNKLFESEGVRGNLINAVITTLFEKSPRDKDHSDRVSMLATDLAKAMNLKPSVITDIRTIGLLHDIGKIVIPQFLLDKSGALTHDEWEQIRQHPAIGYRILSSSKEFSHIASGVLHHHERVDGKGYPEGISGDSIPVESRVICVADAYDAMTAYRAYKKTTLSKKDAAKELKKHINTQFDEEIVRIFIRDVLELDWNSL